jgi:signal transduction histidine kinase
MPGIDGFQVLEMLRKGRAADDHIPVLVITGDATAANKRRAFAAGATDLLAKPFDPSEISMRIRNVLQARFMRLEIEEQNRLLEERVRERTLQLENALENLQTAQRQMLQQERLSAFGEMAGGVVHDFSNALMSIIGYSDQLLRNPAARADEATVLDYLGIINTAGRDGAHVVGRLRDFYRPRGAADMFETLDLNEIASQSIALAKPRSAGRAPDSAISYASDFEPNVTAAGIAPELREVITNLIFNAVDATAGEGLITIRTRQEGEEALLEVQDTGLGMSPEVRSRCLEPFFTTKGEAGTGLGLAMVFGIIQRHQGTMEIDSEPGEGTTFRIRLPIACKTPHTGATQPTFGAIEPEPAVAA